MAEAVSKGDSDAVGPSDVVDMPSASVVVRDIVQFAAPVAAGQGLQFSMNCLVLAACGRIGVDELGAAALSMSMFNATAYSVGVGLGGALDTLLSQIHGKNARDPHYGTVTQRTLLLLLLISMPLGALFAFADVPLQAMGLRHEIVHLSTQFLRVMLFGMPPMLVLEVIRRFLQNMAATTPQAVAQGCAVLSMPLLLWIYIRVCGLGFVGAPLAWVTCVVGMDVGLIVYIRFVAWDRFRDVWGGWNRGALSQWNVIVEQGLPSYLMTLTEWGAFEISNLMSGFLPAAELAAFSITLQLGALLWTVASGVMFAAAFFVGRFIGEARPLVALRYAKGCLVVVIVVATVDATLLNIFWRSIGGLFTDSEAVLSCLQRVIIAQGVFHFFDGQQSTILQILRGCGKQRHGAAVMAFTWVGIGIPLNYVLAFRLGLGAPGLMLGMTAATVAVGFPLYALLLRSFSWSQLAAVDHGRLEGVV